ncbi:MAG: helix-turn-helix domain-containing protein [Anaerolineae bacterium]|nr:helix-turn-helix domain-containing protein [Anaerolineae bacterium]
MSDAELRQPGDVARELDISTSTLRRWAKEFHPYLSKTAGRTDSMAAVGTHRRYTGADVELLSRAKVLLEQGLTYDQVIRRLKREGVDVSPESRGREEVYPVLAPEKGIESPAVGPSLVVVADALRNINDNQQAIQNSLQVNRNLLGVLIQDNFNLKEENTKLRDRVLKLEQTFNQLKQETKERESSPLSPAQQRELQSRKGCLGSSAR